MWKLGLSCRTWRHAAVDVRDTSSGRRNIARVIKAVADCMLGQMCRSRQNVHLHQLDRHSYWAAQQPICRRRGHSALRLRNNRLAVHRAWYRLGFTISMHASMSDLSPHGRCWRRHSRRCCHWQTSCCPRCHRRRMHPHLRCAVASGRDKLHAAQHILMRGRHDDNHAVTTDVI